MSGGIFLCELNEPQRAAVEYTGGPELVVAGAGSGKTRVITYKIAYLIENGHRPGHILALTFTNKAAREMRDRIGKLAGDDVASRLWMGTFHSIFSRILRRHADKIGFDSNFTIYDTSDSKSLIKTIIREMKLDDKVYRPGQVLADISWAKNMLYSPEDYAADKALMDNDRASHRERTVEVYKKYRDRCRIAGAMDFDDLLYYTNVLLRDNADVLDFYRNYFTYILVDEYQDTNFAQHVIVRQLCQGRNNLCVVGDDAQSIYSFRGANIRNILDLQKTFPDLRTFKLEENYRSTRNIIGAANSLIAANKEQIQKEVFSNNETGDPIEVAQAYNDYEEAASVASRLLQVKRRLGLSFNDIAVLYRTNAQSRVLEEALRGRNIAYRVYGGLAFYQRKEVKDAISYFRLSINPHDDEALVRVINTPKRGIGDTTVKKVQAAAIAEGTSIYDIITNPDKYCLEVNKGTKTKLSAFAEMINSFCVLAANDTEASSLANNIVETTGLMKEYLSDNTPEYISKRENLQELLKAVASFTERASKDSPENAGMPDFLAEVSLLTDQDMPADDDNVTLMTIHAAKGLEFGAVFVVGVEEDLLPSSKCRKPQEIEEERRLMYVAITRAKRFCMVSYVKLRTLNGRSEHPNPSRFLYDIDSRYLRLMTGTKLTRRSTYGGETPRPRPIIIEQPKPGQAEPVRVTHVIGNAPSPKASSASPYSTHDVSELSVGMAITHSTYGEGHILDIKVNKDLGDRIIVDFGKPAPQTLLLKFARFTINK